MQTVVQEEDRSKNLMIFGLLEHKDEELNKEVCEVLQTIGEKPRIEACRVGKQRSNKSFRPVKVTAISSAVFTQITTKLNNLSQSEQFKSVLIISDRSAEQRTELREFVNILSD